MKIIIHARRFCVLHDDGSLSALPYRIARFASFAQSAFISEHNRERV